MMEPYWELQILLFGRGGQIIKGASSYIMLGLIVLIFLLFSGARLATARTSHSLHAPDQRIEVRIRLEDRIRYDVLLNGRPLLQDSTLSLKTSSTTLGLNPRVKDAKNRSVDQWIEPVVRQKFAKLRENYNEVRLVIARNYAVVIRAYNEGVDYRLETRLPPPQDKIYIDAHRL